MVLTLIYSPAYDGVDLKPYFQHWEGSKQDLLKEGEEPARATTSFFLLESREGQRREIQLVRLLIKVAPLIDN